MSLKTCPTNALISFVRLRSNYQLHTFFGTEQTSFGVRDSPNLSSHRNIDVTEKSFRLCVRFVFVFYSEEPPPVMIISVASNHMFNQVSVYLKIASWKFVSFFTSRHMEISFLVTFHSPPAGHFHEWKQRWEWKDSWGKNCSPAFSPHALQTSFAFACQYTQWKSLFLFLVTVRGEGWLNNNKFRIMCVCHLRKVTCCWRPGVIKIDNFPA